MLLSHFFYLEPQSLYLLLDTFLVTFVVITLFNMLGKRGEKRILAYFIFFELIHLLMASLLLVATIFDANLPAAAGYSTVLLIVGASGAETAISLALFMRFFRVTGLTSFDKGLNLTERRAEQIYIFPPATTSAV